MLAFCDFANDKNEKNYIHPLVKASILHFLFGYIHPFNDGNGRTARSILYWFLIANGYWLFRYITVSRTIIQARVQYAKAYLYTEYDENDMTYFIKFQLHKIEIAIKALKEHIKEKMEERKNMYDFLKIPDINERQALILTNISTDPSKVISIGEIQDSFGVVYQTARTDLLDLEGKGLLIRRKSGNKLLFFKSDNFDSITQKLQNR